MGRRTRVCSRCSGETRDSYTDEEWADRGELCEQCEEEDLIVLGII